MIIVLTILVYFLVLLLLSRFTGRNSSNETFFRAGRKSPWYMVAFGMVGASISGVTFVSVPGMVLQADMTYLQTCLGFILGYLVVAFVLLPVYYRLNLTTIYTYLLQRLGRRSYKTGAWFFLVSKMAGAAMKFYVVCMLLHRFVVMPMLGEVSPAVVSLSFGLTAAVLVSLIWFYTRRGGIRTLVYTDVFQTVCMLGALVLIVCYVMETLGVSVGDAVRAVAADSHSRIFVFDDWVSRQNFWKQFLSGIFIVVVMTGLDQDMMQKNLTCKTLREAQKDMCSYGLAFVPANLLFLSLGVLLMMLAQKQGVEIPVRSDELLPLFAATGRLGLPVVVLFTIGIVAASFSSADSALTSLTTSYCVDICERSGDERLRRRTHLGMAVVFAVFIIMVFLLNSTSLIDAIYTIVSYTYGPLLGLFAYGLLTKRGVNDRLVPFVALASPLLCFLIDAFSRAYVNYIFGYELLLLNGLITFVGLWALSRNR